MKIKPCTYLSIAMLGAPTLAHAAPPTNAATVAAAKTSPLFERQLTRAELTRSSLAEIQVGAGIAMGLARYVKQSGLDRRPELVPLFDPKLAPRLLTKTPTYSETIYELDDRIVVDRKLVIPLADGACSKSSLPKAVRDLCFRKNPRNARVKAVTDDLDAIRIKLAKAPPDKVVHDGVTAARAAKMNDDQLLELLLNGDDRTIHHVSVIPRVPLARSGVKTLSDFRTKLPKRTVQTLPRAAKGPLLPPKPGQIWGTSKSFPTRYFLTGFTVGRTIADSLEVEFAESTWLTDRYYAKFSYHVDAGFGMRLPFSVAVKSGGMGDTRDVTLAVAPVDVDEHGNPAYPAVRLPKNKAFDGDEFVLQFEAGCNLYVSVPGPNLDKDCPTPPSMNRSQDLDPVLGTESAKIRDWWLEGSDTGLKLDYGIARVQIDLGVEADMTNGKIGVKLAPLPGSRFTTMAAGTRTFTDRTALGFGMKRDASATRGGFRIEQPTYGFDLRVVPRVRIVAGIDVGVFEHTWTMGAFSADDWAIEAPFVLGRHDDTIDHHDYEVFGTSPDKAQPNDGPASAP